MAELTPDEVNRIIRERLHVKHHDCLPFTGWNNPVSRNGLAKIFGELGYKVGAEIGVRSGGYSKILCENIPGLKVFCVDPYLPYRGRRPSQEKMDTIFNQAQKQLAGYDVTFIRKTSLQATKDIPDGSLDFVYIDGLHEWDPVACDIIFWTPKIRIGGIVAGHDYVESYACGVVNAVRAYTTAHCINEWYLTSVDSDEKEKNPSWFFVRNGHHTPTHEGNLW